MRRGLALGLGFGEELRAFGVAGEDDIEQALGAVGRFLGEPADAHARGGDRPAAARA